MGASNLKRQGLTAIKWNLAGKFVKRSAQFVISVILARLLSPDDFGVVAIAMIFINWADVFKDFGIGQSIIQNQNVSETQLSTIFYLNLLMGLGIALLLFILAPFASYFYDNNMVGWVVRFAGVNFFIQSFNVVQLALFQKKIDYKTYSNSSVLSVIVTGLGGIIMAFNGFGVWSLIAPGILGHIISGLYLWKKSQWRPRRIFNFEETKSLFSLGVAYMSNGFVNTVFSSLDSMVIGKYYNLASVGFFTRGKNLVDMIQTTFLTPISYPLFPVFVKIQDDISLLQRNFFKITAILDWITLFLSGFVLLNSEEIIISLYGIKWLNAAHYLFLFAIIIPVYPAWLTSIAVWKARGRAKTIVRFSMIERTLMLLALIIGVFHSIDMYLYLLILVSYFCALVKSYYNKVIINLNILKQYREWIKNIVVILPALVILKIVDVDNVYISFVVKTIVYILYYLLMSYIFKLKGLSYIYQELIQRKSK